MGKTVCVRNVDSLLERDESICFYADDVRTSWNVGNVRGSACVKAGVTHAAMKSGRDRSHGADLAAVRPVVSVFDRVTSS